MIEEYLENFTLNNENVLFKKENTDTKIEEFKINDIKINKYINEYWTSKQRQAKRIHEVSYRACFKPQLPNFFINLLTKEKDIVYDPFLGRGTTIIEAALLNRNVIGNDINPLSIILSEGRFLIPNLNDLKDYLNSIPLNENIDNDFDLSMFYDKNTLIELLNLKKYLNEKKNNEGLNDLDKWIRMVATNRLSGHSKGFFSVYSMPPNQAVSRERQIKINEKYKQKPDYRNVKEIILKKSNILIKNLNVNDIKNLKNIHSNALFLNNDARKTNEIPDNYVQLTVTSPPFLDVIQYASDNWLRCWFNDIDVDLISKRITMSKKIEDWILVMKDVFKELYRITKPHGYVAFEVGEVKNGKINLDEYIVPIGNEVGFTPKAIIINEQIFTKTANIWGVKNNSKGTNSNRIVLFQK